MNGIGILCRWLGLLSLDLGLELKRNRFGVLLYVIIGVII